MVGAVLSLEHIARMDGGSLPSEIQEGAFTLCILLFCWCEEVVKITLGG
jgi:hypothetical protein